MLKRKISAFRPGTTANHTSQIKAYLLFCVHYNLEEINPSAETICLYVEFLARSVKSPRAVLNYISGVRYLHKAMGARSDNLYCFELELMLRAINITMDHCPKTHILVTPEVLYKICKVCDHITHMGVVYKCAFLFSNFGFLRRSNLAPLSQRTFNPKLNTCRGDIFHSHPGLVVLLKWTKTCQTRDRTALIPLPRVKGHPLCPVDAYHRMCQLIPTRSANDPLLTSPRRRVVTASELNKVLKVVCEILGVGVIGMHSLRRAGAETSYRSGFVSISDIKKHGTWQSDAFWSYISKTAIATTSAVPGVMRNIVKTSVKVTDQ